MSAAEAFSTWSFSEAKAGLSDVMSGVVREHRPTVVERHKGKEAMLLLGLADLKALLDHFSFTTKASVSEGEFVLRQPELGLVAGGESFEDAARELEELSVAYAERFFARLGFYMQTDRAAHMPWLLRVALTPPRERAALLLPGEPVERPAVPEESERVEHEAWVVAVLTRDLHMTAEQITALGAEEARQRVLDHWSRPAE